MINQETLNISRDIKQVQKFRALNVFCGSSRTLLLGVMLGGGLPSLMRKSHMLRLNWVEGIHNSCCFPHHLVPMALISPHGSSLFTPEAALFRVRLRPLRWQLLLVMLQGGQARTLCLRLLWKEAVALKACPGSQSPEIWSWAPTPRPC